MNKYVNKNIIIFTILAVIFCSSTSYANSKNNITLNASNQPYFSPHTHEYTQRKNFHGGYCMCCSDDYCYFYEMHITAKPKINKIKRTGIEKHTDYNNKKYKEYNVKFSLSKPICKMFFNKQLLQKEYPSKLDVQYSNNKKDYYDTYARYSSRNCYNQKNFSITIPNMKKVYVRCRIECTALMDGKSSSMGTPITVHTIFYGPWSKPKLLKLK